MTFVHFKLILTSICVKSNDFYLLKTQCIKNFFHLMQDNQSVTLPYHINISITMR